MADPGSGATASRRALDRRALGDRLKGLRDELGVTQKQVAAALGGRKPLSLTIVSNWENGRMTPTLDRLEAYGRLFATDRSLDGAHLRLLSAAELTEEERETARAIELELVELRQLRESADEPPVTVPDVARPIEDPVEDVVVPPTRMWHFPDGQPIVIIGSRVTDPTLRNHPYASPRHPNHMPLLLQPDGFSVVELFGHLRAENPRSLVRFKTEDEVDADDLSGHVVVVGGPDVNPHAAWFGERMNLPLGGVTEGEPDDPSTLATNAAFTIYEEKQDAGTGETTRIAKDIFKPVFEGTLDVEIGGVGEAPRRMTWPNLVYDIALLARQPNPLNLSATATLIYGLYANGTYGAVRTFTDARLRDVNERYRRTAFGDTELFWILMRVPCHQRLGVVTTPDLNRPYNRVYEWFE